VVGNIKEDQRRSRGIRELQADEEKEESEKRHSYKRLIVGQNAHSLCLLVHGTTERFPKTELRRVAHMRDAAPSVKQHIQEGYKRPSRGESMQFPSFSQSSLAELSGDVEDCLEDGLMNNEECKELDSLCGKTDCLFNRLIKSLRRKQKEGTWSTGH
jgi:four helix bundle protein